MEFERTKSNEEEFITILDEQMMFYELDGDEAEAEEEEMSWDEFWDMYAREEMCTENEFAEASTKHHKCKAKHSKRRKNNLSPRKRGKRQKGSWSHAEHAWNYCEREIHRELARRSDMKSQLHEYDFPEEEIYQEEYEYEFDELVPEREYYLDKGMLLKRIQLFKKEYSMNAKELELLNILQCYLNMRDFTKKERVYYGQGYLGLDFFKEEVIQAAFAAMSFKLEFVSAWEDSYVEFTFIE